MNQATRPYNFSFALIDASMFMRDIVVLIWGPLRHWVYARHQRGLKPIPNSAVFFGLVPKSQGTVQKWQEHFVRQHDILKNFLGNLKSTP